MSAVCDETMEGIQEEISNMRRKLPTRRDLFAAAALQGLLANPAIAATIDMMSANAAEAQGRVVGLAFEYADAMALRAEAGVRS